MAVYRSLTPRLAIAALGVGGLITLLIAAPHAAGQVNLVRAAALIWFIGFAALAAAKPTRRKD